MKTLLTVDANGESFVFWDDGSLSSYARHDGIDIDIDLSKKQTKDLYLVMKAFYEGGKVPEKWISVNDMLPDSIELKKYKVKLEVGSVDVKEIETVMLGKMYPSQFRFMTGDWQRVTHWKEFKDS